MSIQEHIIGLHKRKIISEKPRPIIPFILFFIILVLLIPAFALHSALLILIITLLAIFTLIFAILHLIVVLILRKSRK